MEKTQVQFKSLEEMVEQYIVPSRQAYCLEQVKKYFEDPADFVSQHIGIKFSELRLFIFSFESGEKTKENAAAILKKFNIKVGGLEGNFLIQSCIYADYVKEMVVEEYKKENPNSEKQATEAMDEFSKEAKEVREEKDQEQKNGDNMEGLFGASSEKGRGSKTVQKY